MWTTVARTKRRRDRKIPTSTSFGSAPPLLASEFGAFRHGFFSVCKLLGGVHNFQATKRKEVGFLSCSSHSLRLWPLTYKEPMTMRLRRQASYPHSLAHTPVRRLLGGGGGGRILAGVLWPLAVRNTKSTSNFECLLYLLNGNTNWNNISLINPKQGEQDKIPQHFVGIV